MQASSTMLSSSMNITNLPRASLAPVFLELERNDLDGFRRTLAGRSTPPISGGFLDASSTITTSSIWDFARSRDRRRADRSRGLSRVTTTTVTSFELPQSGPCAIAPPLGGLSVTKVFARAWDAH